MPCSEVIYDSSANDFDRFDALNADLADKRQQLADKKEQADKERATSPQLKDCGHGRGAAAEGRRGRPAEGRGRAHRA